MERLWFYNDYLKPVATNFYNSQRVLLLHFYCLRSKPGQREPNKTLIPYFSTTSQGNASEPGPASSGAGLRPALSKPAPPQGPRPRPTFFPSSPKPKRRFGRHPAEPAPRHQELPHLLGTQIPSISRATSFLISWLAPSRYFIATRLFTSRSSRSDRIPSPAAQPHSPARRQNPDRQTDPSPQSKSRHRLAAPAAPGASTSSEKPSPCRHKHATPHA